MTTPLIITQLPSILEDSPMFGTYDSFVTGALESLHSDLEEVFFMTDVSQLNRLKFKLQLLGHGRTHFLDPSDAAPGLDRLLKASMYDNFQESTRWLSNIIETVIRLSPLVNKQTVCLMTDPGYLGAYIVGMERTPAQTLRALAGGSLDNQLGRIRRRVCEKVLRHIRDQSLERRCPV